jgi:predicted phage terminase large subunit-like protein
MSAKGGIFKEHQFRYFEESGDHYVLTGPTSIKAWSKDECWLFATLDLAVTTKTSSDWTVLMVWAVTPENELLLLEVFRERLEHPDQGKLVSATYTQYGKRFAAIDIESNQYQLALVQELVRAGFPANSVRADKDKLARALPAATRVAAGMVYFRAGADWLHELKPELVVFTGKNDKHDDQVDNFSLAARRVSLNGDAEYWTSEDDEVWGR